MEELDDRLHWYKDAIIYELHIKAFCDSNNDGIGDFGGLLEKLDYLQELGITAIWLLPFYPSPLKDDGYDIADYYSINSNYGTVEQFRILLKEAHKRNLKIITELVINHTSDQHPWFQKARRAEKGSPERSFYVWTDDPTLYKDVRIIFQDFESSNWAWDPVAQQYYWHRFFHHQPDLNYENPLVQQEIFNLLDYWCAMGIDGFRLDAIPYLFEQEGTNSENLPQTHAFLKKLRAHVDEHYPGTLLLAEANMWPEDSASYFGNGDECHMNYHFPVMPRIFMALHREDRYPITDIFDQTPPIPSTCQWAIFLRNHDELTLEMVTDEERDYMYKVYAKDPKARINLGIRHRLAPLMDNDRRKIELMNSLLFSMPGTPVIYYGDEIGMGDNFYLGDRDGVRTPMQWSPDRNAGFSTAHPHRLYLPVIIDPEYHYEAVNVELQQRNTSSLFWFMKHLITVRKKHKAFGRGSLKFIKTDNPKVLAFTRTWKKEVLLIIVNLSKYSQAAELFLSQYAGYIPVDIFSKSRFPAIRNTPYFFTLSPHSFLWFELQLEASLKKIPVSKIKLGHLDDLFNSAQAELETVILPPYLLTTNWFTGKSRNLYAISIVEKITITTTVFDVYFLLIELTYETGLPEIYSLPICFIKEDLAKNIKENYPQSIITQINAGNETGVLCDAFYTTEFQHWLLKTMTDNAQLHFTKSILHFSTRDLVTKYLKNGSLTSRIHQDSRSHTSINYSNQLLLKMYRKVDKEMNPDIEISEFLTEKALFPYLPAYLGKIEWETEKGSISLGMMQVMVENHGDGISYMHERLNNYIERVLARRMSVYQSGEQSAVLVQPVPYDQLSQELQTLLGSHATEFSRLLGIRTAQLHLALASDVSESFLPQPFSLHYQRSLFSSMQSLIRETFQTIDRKIKELPAPIQTELEELKIQRDQITDELKKICIKKMDALKIRIHGNLRLHHVLLTGKDIFFHDFGGNPNKNYSERKIRRSPLRDVTTMIRSIYYTAHKAFFNTGQVPNEEIKQLLPFAGLWAHHMSSFFLNAYLEQIQASSLIPQTRPDLQIMVRTFLLEEAISDLNYELNNQPEYTIIPLRMIYSILNGYKIKA